MASGDNHYAEAVVPMSRRVVRYAGVIDEIDWRIEK
jgi:hypothetical protein